MADHLRTELVTGALVDGAVQKAPTTFGGDPPLVDRGSRYTALSSFGECLKEEAGVFEYIEGFYNPTRRHSSIGYMSPADYERAIVEEVRVA